MKGPLGHVKRPLIKQKTNKAVTIYYSKGCKMKTACKNVLFMNILQKMFYKLPQRVHFIGEIKIFIAVPQKKMG